MNDNSRQQSILRVAAICQPDVISLALDSALAEAIECMAAHKVGAILIEAQGQALGLMTRRRAMRLILEQGADARIHVEALLPILHVSADLDVDELGFEFISQNATHALVFAATGQRLGIVSQSDIINNQGLAHDLFLKSLNETTNFDVLRLPGSCSLRMAVERMYSVNYSAVLVGGDEFGWRIMTDTDVMRLLAQRQCLDTLLAELALPELVAVDGDMSLFNARRYFKENSFRHIGVKDRSGQVIGLASYRDILRSVEMDYIYRLRTLLHDKSHALNQSQHNLRLIERVVSTSREGVLITDAEGHIQSVNPAFTAITGYEPWEALGNNPNMLSSGRHDAQFYTRLWSVLQDEGSWQGEIWNRHKDGSVYPEWLSITAIKDDAGAVTQYAAIFHDLTETKRSEARVRQLSWFDSVTGLANRHLFEDRLQQAYHYSCEQQQLMALVALDLDLFKQVNDRFGHKGGDLLLKQVAERIESTLDGSGTASRPAGDEFYIILSELPDHTALNAYLERLGRVLSMPFWISHDEIRLQVSMGVALAPQDAPSSEALIRAAEVALRHSKESGRNTCCFFSTEQHAATLSRYHIAGLLQQALERNEFSMVYQPQLCVKSGQLVGVEALIRWHNPELGAVSPELFIPVAEDAGMIEAIGNWVLERSVSEAVQWARHDLHMKLSVNFSVRQFQRGEVADRIMTVLQQHAFPADQFVVELTETCFMHSAEATERALIKLREQGVRIAIDDFGTGYSSLSYIRNMSLDVIKIDRSFVSQICASDTGGRLVQAMIDMGHAMDLEVVAEGVESVSDFEVLKQLGCDQAQGYYIARPMSSAALIQWATELSQRL
ncbi:diguanylate cyclase/phosphodiesterase with PAS/PAC sensor(s) [Marinobacterium halophilum]|uniref:Diguanylate cyclase/phosphodiesterase with PAS/PAC sensor(S) n=1 Tax=Marinobacterium halophilum TaxID=267374 RepID=A0A2P8EUZ9_9GAMM|nr:EAL domain-containing protein [Marinobacterium halophilum]PSL13255.1 diguanylate cyclase/phosphodiesterase with PAS/PAC sensor(s) [Marinobacterium halophilum]